MSDALEKPDAAAMLERVVIVGNLAELTPPERLIYYQAVCESVKLNPLTKPFDYLQLGGRLVLYANKTATDQLRTNRGVSITKLEKETSDGIHTVTAYAKDAKGRTDASTGSVSIEGLRGEAKANAKMRAETKAKRRVTLSLCGLGILDESETEDAVLAEQLKDTQTGQPETTVITELFPTDAAVDKVEAELNKRKIEAQRLSRQYGLKGDEIKRYKKEHLHDELADILAVTDPAAIADMIAAMRRDHEAKA